MSRYEPQRLLGDWRTLVLLGGMIKMHEDLNEIGKGQWHASDRIQPDTCIIQACRRTQTDSVAEARGRSRSEVVWVTVAGRIYRTRVERVAVQDTFERTQGTQECGFIMQRVSCERKQFSNNIAST